VKPRVGRLRFVTSPDHRHWHLLGFMRYELRDPRSGALVRPDRKTGFCLGDRYDAGRREPRKPRREVFRSDCVPDPDVLSLREGISVGYGDDYRPQLEGQFVDLTGLAPGRYLLVHRVDSARRLRERRRSNNASSLLIELRWPRGMARRPRVKRLATCPRSGRCPAR
jgi:hypothetical protein